MLKCVILRGVPGCGKTTLIKKEYQGADVFSADHFFTTTQGEYRFDPARLPEAHGQYLREFLSAVVDHRPLIVVDNTATSVAEVAPYAAMALAFDYELEIVTLQCDPAIAGARNVHGVPADLVVKMAARLEEESLRLPPWWPHRVVPV